MQRLNARGELNQSIAEAIPTLSAVDGPGVRQKIRALNQFHGEEPNLIIAEQLIELHKIGMDQANQRTKLTLEPRKASCIQPPQSLERNDRIPLTIQHPVNDPERTLSKPLL